MMNILLSTLPLVLLAGLQQEPGTQETSFRPPAAPLVTCDPYFSIWSFSDHPAKDWPRHWTGAVQALCNIVNIDGTTFRLLGASPDSIQPMALQRTSFTPTRTIYDFEDMGVHISATYMTPLLPNELESISRPVSYISWKVRSVDGKGHSVSIYFDASAALAVNSPGQDVVWSRLIHEDYDLLSVGSREQAVLQKSGDNLRIDWGYFYLMSPKNQHAQSVIASHTIPRGSFVRHGSIPTHDDMRMPRPANDEWPVLAYQLDMGTIDARPQERFLVMVYDDQYSIEYFHRSLQPYWKAHGKTTENLLLEAVGSYEKVAGQCTEFDRELMADLRNVGGEKYARVATLAYRQAIAAHKLAVDIDGTPLLFPKENFSNGCIGTVDVIYPTAPLFLLFNPALLKAAVTPVLQYSMLTRWRFPFAPHDLGTYPRANGQVYGGGERTEENQMPVEECGNMLLLVYAIAHVDRSAEYALPYWKSLEKWANYLREKGFDPENQLCTDDFAGHLAHNVNLSLKAILALGAYSRLCDMLGKKTEAETYWQVAERFAQHWQEMANDGDHYRLAFDKPGTWSQKYNLVWDRLLGLNLFPKEVARKEVRYYRSKQNQFGLPLDSRKDYTKLDWVLWTASLSEEQSDFEEIVSRVFDFINKTPTRVPLTDWYDTKDAKQIAFQARSVVGGVFVKMLANDAMWRKWSGRATK